MSSPVDPWEDEDAIPIPLGGKGIFAFVSREDIHLAKMKWHSKHYPKWGLIYALRMKYDKDGRHNQLLHRVVMGVSESKLPKVDHINGNGLDCRRCNLRLASSEMNGRNVVGPGKRNTSGYLGVSFVEAKQKWCAQMRWDKKNHHLGYFETAEEANQARLEAEQKIWGIHPRRRAAHQ